MDSTAMLSCTFGWRRLLAAGCLGLALYMAPAVASAQPAAAAPPTGYSQGYPPAPAPYYPPPCPNCAPGTPPPGYYPLYYPNQPNPQPMVKAENTLFVELLGNGLFWSVNYERYLSESVTARVGVGYYSVGVSGSGGSASASVTTFPLLVNYILGKSSNKFEVGAGVVLLHASASASVPGSSDGESGSVLMGTATAGYRYAPYDGGFVFRAGISPIFGHGFFLPWPGISFGYGF